MLPALNKAGDLPSGVHRATLVQVVERFSIGSAKRKLVGLRLERIYRLATSTNQVRKFVIFGSFITAKPEPNDLDVFLLMEDNFDVSQVSGEARLIFDHLAAQSHFGASVFWLRRLAALGGEEATIRQWQLKRDGTLRGIVEIAEETS